MDLGTVIGIIFLLICVGLILALRNFLIWLCDRSSIARTVVGGLGLMAGVSIVKKFMRDDRD